MAARLRPEQVSAAHQSLHHLVAQAAWSDEALLAAVREQVLPALGPITAWIVDDTGFAKKGRHSVGVARQCCGVLGKPDNGQVAVSLSVANEQASLPVAYRLYLPQAWADDPARRHKAGVPEAVVFQTKPQIAPAQIRAALAQGVPPGVVPADAGYGADMDFQQGLCRRKARMSPLSKAGMSIFLSVHASWEDELGLGDDDRSEPWPELWLLVEWPEGEKEPTRFRLAHLPADAPLMRLVGLAKLRRRIERDDQEFKQAGRQRRPGAGPLRRAWPAGLSPPR